MIDNRRFLRNLLTVIVAAAAGSLTATLLIGLIGLFLGGPGEPDPVRTVIAFSAITMIFSLPGAMLLVGVRTALALRDVRRIVIDGVTAATGAIAGGLMLTAGDILSFEFLIGTLYGLMTALALILFDRLLIRFHY